MTTTLRARVAAELAKVDGFVKLTAHGEAKFNALATAAIRLVVAECAHIADVVSDPYYIAQDIRALAPDAERGE